MVDFVRLAPRIFLAPPGVDVDNRDDLPPDAFVFRTWAEDKERAAFGDGSHPTTRLCARAVDLLCRQAQPSRVIDVGAGTGVLARIARAHGAQVLAATDIAPEALLSAKQNAALDRAGTRENPNGAVIAVENALPTAWPHPFDLVVANILQGPLTQLAPAIVEATAPGGDILLSGFTRPQVPALKVVYGALGARLKAEASDGEWVVLHLQK